MRSFAGNLTAGHPASCITEFYQIMNILLLGSGGREHALAWKMKQSPLCEALYIATGNAGTAQVGINVAIGINDFEKLGQFCLDHNVTMVVAGSEEPLVNGVYDYFANQPELKEIAVIGPTREGAQLEGSKAFSKKFMERHNIPTAAYREFSMDNVEEGVAYVQQHSLPVVIKADGLAAGKGVVICEDNDSAVAEFNAMVKEAKFGAASAKVVIEQFLKGIECSVFAITDGENYLTLPVAKDYKRIGEGDTGLNTGGMGAVSPVPFANDAFMQMVDERIVKPTVAGLKQEGILYKGFIFFGLIEVDGEPFVIEYNCRMGDPETEVVMPRLQNDLVALFEAVRDGKLNEHTIEQDPRHAVTVMLVSGGYPGDYAKGKVMAGLDQVQNSLLFHAGTAQKDGEVVTSGGRVIAITSLAGSLSEALQQSKSNAEKITFDGRYYRKDIGYEFES